MFFLGNAKTTSRDASISTTWVPRRPRWVGAAKQFATQLLAQIAANPARATLRQPHGRGLGDQANPPAAGVPVAGHREVSR